MWIQFLRREIVDIFIIVIAVGVNEVSGFPNPNTLPGQRQNRQVLAVRLILSYSETDLRGNK